MLFDPGKINKVLVLMPDKHMGNLIVALPAVDAIRKFYMDKQCYLLIDESYIEIAEAFGITGRLITYPRKPIAGAGWARRAALFIKLLITLRPMSPDIVIDLEGRELSSALAFLTGSPLRAGWDAAPPAYVALMPLWWRDRRPEGVLFEAVHDGTTLALRLVWEDDTENLSNLLQQDFHDGAAVQLSWDEDPPFFGMGDEASAVTIWSWKASWQRDEQGFQDIESIYPAMHLDTYPSQTDLKPGERPDPAAVSAPHHDPLYLSGWGAGNPMSNPRRASAVEVAGAKGQGSLTTALREAQLVQGTGTWDRGIWTLEMRTKLPPERCKGLSVAFAVWDGASNDRNGQKSVTIWHRLDLED